MAGNTLKKEVLKAYKSLHRTRLYVFEGDGRALKAARDKINEEFKKCKNLDKDETILEKIEFSKAIEKELRTNIIQAKQVKPGRFEARIRPETTKLDNFPFDPDIEIPRAKRRELAKECCQIKIE